jgi:hypothetical protein
MLISYDAKLENIMVYTCFKYIPSFATVVRVSCLYSKCHQFSKKNKDLLKLVKELQVRGSVDQQTSTHRGEEHPQLHQRRKLVD